MTRTLPEDTLVENDICIGAGAAGITLAGEFINQPYQVCLLESGGLDFDEVSNPCIRVRILGCYCR